MDSVRPLYSAVVSDNADEIDSLLQVETLSFGTFQEAMDNAERYAIKTQRVVPHTPKDHLRTQFMEELAAHLAPYIVDIQDNLGFHGFANEIQLYDVMKCFENNVVVDVVQDGNMELFSEEDDAN